MHDQLVAIDLLLKARDLKKAEKLIAKQLRATISNEQKSRLLIYRAQTRLMNGRPEGALRDLQDARELDDAPLNEAYALELLADCHFAQFELSPTGFADRKDAELAQRIYRRIIQEFAEYDNLGWVYYQLARVMLTANEIEGASEYLQLALLKPSHISELTAYCYERLGFIAYYEQRNAQSALTFLKKALNTFPLNSKSHGWLIQVHILCGRVYKDIGKLDLALEETEKAIKIGEKRGNKDRAGYAEALLSAGEILSGIAGRQSDVIAYLEQYLVASKKPLGVDVTWARAYEMLADAYSIAGMYQKAINAYNAVLQYNPYHPWEFTIYYRIGRAYYQVGDYEHALKAIHRALELADSEDHTIDHMMYDVFGSAYFALGKYEEAANAYRQALKTAPANDTSTEKIEQYYRFSLEKINGTL